MKRYLIILILLVFSVIYRPQSLLFEKINGNSFLSNSSSTKLMNLLNKSEIINSEQLNYIGPTLFTKGYKGIFNILNYNIGFTIKDDYGIGIAGVHGYLADLDEGGYSIISISSFGVTSTIFYKEQIFDIQPIFQNVHLITEINIQKMGYDNSNDVMEKSTGKIVNISPLTTLSANPLVNVLVVFTQDAAGGYRGYSWIVSKCK